MTVTDILDQIAQKSVLVLGDICLDRWCRYDPTLSEPSRETGIPRTAVVATELSPGAAGTIAGNLTALLTKQVAVLGVIGNDGFGVELERALMAREISPELVVKSAEVPTFTYTKLINAHTGEEDRPRVDFINPREMPEEVQRDVIAHLRAFWSAFDIVLVCDQAETNHGGVVTPRVREALCDLAASDRDRVVWVDSRMRAEQFRHTVLKCNLREAREASERAFGDYDPERLRQATGSPLLVVTDGSNGAYYRTEASEGRVPTKAVDHPVDICGAGDSFSAGAALALSITKSPEEALRFGNMVSSITIMKKGTGIATPVEVLQTASTWPI